MTIKELEAAALAAGKRSESWGSFWQRHREDVRLAAPHDRAAFHRLHGRLLHLHLTGDDAASMPPVIPTPGCRGTATTTRPARRMTLAPAPFATGATIGHPTPSGGER